MIHLMVSTPERWTLPLVGASEMVGCVLFRALRDRRVELFADEPAVAERIRLLYNEILSDEIGHLGFIAARLDEHGRSMMRRLYARLASTLASQFSEIDALFGSCGDGETLFCFPSGGRGRGAAEPRIRSGADLSWASQKERNQLNQIRFTGLALAAIALAGCSDQTLTASREQPRCELMVSDICSMAMQTRMLEGVVNASDTSKPDEAHLEAFVIPLLLRKRTPRRDS